MVADYPHWTRWPCSIVYRSVLVCDWLVLDSQSACSYLDWYRKRVSDVEWHCRSTKESDEKDQRRQQWGDLRRVEWQRSVRSFLSWFYAYEWNASDAGGDGPVETCQSWGKEFGQIRYLTSSCLRLRITSFCFCWARSVLISLSFCIWV